MRRATALIAREMSWRRFGPSFGGLCASLAPASPTSLYQDGIIAALVDHRVRALRGPCESYRDVILRLARTGNRGGERERP
jgi:hypothetical protein